MNNKDLFTPEKHSEPKFKKIKVSGKWMRRRFLCSKDYIINECHGSCCEGSEDLTISLLPDEEEYFKFKGYKVEKSKLYPDQKTGLCPFKNENGLCELHNSEHKPFGCIVSPFYIKKNTLQIRNRYTLMKCHIKGRGSKKGEYAYKVFRPSLDLIFGKEEAERVCKLLDAGLENIKEAKISIEVYDKLNYLESLKTKGRVNNFLKRKIEQRTKKDKFLNKWL